MNKLLAAVVTFLVFAAGATPVSAQPRQLKGSDTLRPLVTEAIRQLSLSDQLEYLGTGSGKGERALLDGAQAIAPMSRLPTEAAMREAQQKGLALLPHVIGLDGIVMLVKADNPVSVIDLATLKNMYSGSDGSGSEAACAGPDRIRDWSQVPNSPQSGPIELFRRGNDSGTTDTFKSLAGIGAFCADVTVVEEADQLAEMTATRPAALAYLGLSGERPSRNKALAIASTPAAPYVTPTVDSIRSLQYPLARRLFFVEADGRVAPETAEARLLGAVLSPAFANPLLEAADFVSCLPGCPAP